MWIWQKDRPLERPLSGLDDDRQRAYPDRSSLGLDWMWSIFGIGEFMVVEQEQVVALVRLHGLDDGDEVME